MAVLRVQGETEETVVVLRVQGETEETVAVLRVQGETEMKVVRARVETETRMDDSCRNTGMRMNKQNSPQDEVSWAVVQLIAEPLYYTYGVATSCSAFFPPYYIYSRGGSEREPVCTFAAAFQNSVCF